MTTVGHKIILEGERWILFLVAHLNVDSIVNYIIIIITHFCYIVLSSPKILPCFVFSLYNNCIAIILNLKKVRKTKFTDLLRSVCCTKNYHKSKLIMAFFVYFHYFVSHSFLFICWAVWCGNTVVQQRREKMMKSVSRNNLLLILLIIIVAWCGMSNAAVEVSHNSPLIQYVGKYYPSTSGALFSW